MANTKITSRVISDNAVGTAQLNLSDGSSGQAIVTDGSGTISFADVGIDGIVSNANATAITIDSSENVGIGNTSMSSYDSNARNLVVGSGTGDEGMTIASGSGSGGRIYFADGTSGDAQKADGYIFYNHASQYMALGTAATERMRILSGGGITFNGDTATANALDDYEEGTWTPAFYTYSGVTTSSITITLATYTKIGNICHIHANITATLSSLPGQTVTITGLPFAASGTDQYGIIAVGGHTVNTGANTPKAHFRTNGSQLDGIAYNASSNTAFWTYSSMDAQPFEMSIHGFYTTT